MCFLNGRSSLGRNEMLTVAKLVKEQVARSLQAVEKKQKGLFVVDKIGDSLFTPEIREIVIPRIFNVPTIAQFDKKVDPVEHVRNHTTSLLARNATDEIKCLLFLVTLKGIASTWFHSLPPWNGDIQP
ncbi:hypothetical protein CRG98_050028 [Punica granatum]|uniref:Retrotransposon gag domain-containing protein n=1 Tax=Punica granatum TaxID=22663 RepID=A0A2I0GTB1_PUNGR|nr:hypothetical protein CRG98_050028 [Punica granatum]